MVFNSIVQEQCWLVPCLDLVLRSHRPGCPLDPRKVHGVNLASESYLLVALGRVPPGSCVECHIFGRSVSPFSKPHQR
ncbi:hypothetical protein I79_002557 [Cricetulus griseus]|uniref:Uncharacterized protein n=1 Tax=Cricetulus griseus TaxID=10029 RepID=G3GXR5_CRIGR|nr:hypothetical protein I79_002557 [Cricetulus griseus]